MAFADYDQNEIVAQIQTYLHLKREVDPTFIQGTELPPVDGQLGGPGSQTNKAIEAWLQSEGLSGTIDPNDPNYLEKLYDAARSGFIADPRIAPRMQGLSRAATTPEDEVQNRLVQLMEERRRLELRLRQAPADDPLYSQQLIDQLTYTNRMLAEIRGEESGLEQVEKDQGLLAGNGNYGSFLRLAAAMLGIGGSVLLADGTDPQTATTAAAQAVLGQETWVVTADAAPPGGADPETPAPAGETEPAADPSVLNIDPYTASFVENTLLNNGDYSVHAQRVWDMLRRSQGEKTSAELIDEYILDLNKQYKSEHGTDIPGAQIDALRTRINNEIVQIREETVKYNGIKPTPEQLAENFVNDYILPKLTDDARRLYQVVHSQGVPVEQAVKDFVDSKSLTAEDAAALTESLTQEIESVDVARGHIIEYENIQPTPEDMVRIVGESYQQVAASLSNPPEHYVEIMQAKMAYYQSPEGGAYDALTAAARATVDARAQMDRDNGAPERAIIDENSPYYQGEIAGMADWLRGRVYVEQQMAEAAANGETLTKTEAARQLDDFAYVVYRHDNEQGTVEAVYAQTHPEAAPPAADNETGAAPPATGPQTSVEAAAMQVALAQEVLAAAVDPETGVNKIQQNARLFASVGIDVSSPEALAQSLRDPNAQTALQNMLGMAVGMGQIDQTTVDAMNAKLAQFNELEELRKTLPETLEVATPGDTTPGDTTPEDAAPDDAAPDDAAPDTAPAPETQLDQVMAGQVSIAEHIIAATPDALHADAEILMSGGIDVSSPEKLAESLRDPAARENFETYIAAALGAGQIDQATLNTLKSELAQFDELEGTRKTLTPATDADAGTAPPAAAPGLTEAFGEEAAPQAPAEEAPVAPAPLSADDMETMAEIQQHYYYEYLAMSHSSDAAFMNATEAKLNDLMRYAEGTDPAAFLQASHDFVSYMKTNIGMQESAFMEANWDRLKPYLDKYAPGLGDHDYAAGAQTLREHYDEIITDTYHERGADLRATLQGQEYLGLRDGMVRFSEELQKVEDLAKSYNVDPDAAPPALPPPEEKGSSWNPMNWF